MSIEFRCTECQKLLAVPAGTTGQKAKCPQCGTVLIIPEVSSSDEAEGVDHLDAPPPREPGLRETQPLGKPQAANPFQSPSGQALYSAQSPAQRTFHPTRIGVGDTLSKTWQIYTSNLGILIVGSLLANVCGSVASTLAWGISVPLIDNGGAIAIPFCILAVVAAVMIQVFFLIGLMQFMLNIARGQQGDVADLFRAGPLTLPGTAVLVLLVAGTVAGAAFCLIPGLIFLLIFSQSLYILLDQRTGIVDSFKHSAAAMKGNALTLFGLACLVIIAAPLFVKMTCGIGWFFAAPFVSLLWAVIYVGVTGQSMVAQHALHRDAERGFDSPGMQPT